MDTRGAGGLFSREETSNGTVLNRADNIVHQSFVNEGDFASRSVVVTTWDNVGYFDTRADRVFEYKLANGVGHACE